MYRHTWSHGCRHVYRHRRGHMFVVWSYVCRDVYTPTIHASTHALTHKHAHAHKRSLARTQVADMHWGVSVIGHSWQSSQICAFFMWHAQPVSIADRHVERMSTDSAGTRYDPPRRTLSSRLWHIASTRLYACPCAIHMSYPSSWYSFWKMRASFISTHAH